MDALLSVGEETFRQWILVWGAMGCLSAVAIHFSGLMPMSGRADNSVLAFLGVIDKKRGWIIMETPVLIAVLAFYLYSARSFGVATVFVAVFVFHYTNRALIFPHRIHTEGKTMAVSMMLSSMLFYIVNGYFVGYYFGALADYPLSWLWDPRFVGGLLLFVVGFVINVQSDNILIRLRAPGETGYKIPRGGLFRYISCPNYFGEILEWIGFALMSWSLIGVVYALWVGLPLIAQGWRAHQWYRQHFAGDYPKERRAIIPFIL